jgi:hypothetical protein
VSAAFHLHNQQPVAFFNGGKLFLDGRPLCWSSGDWLRFSRYSSTARLLVAVRLLMSWCLREKKRNVHLLAGDKNWCLLRYHVTAQGD